MAKNDAKRVLTVTFKTRQDKYANPQENTAALDVTGVTLDEALPPAVKSWIIDLQREMRKAGLELFPPSDIIEVDVKALVAGRVAVVTTAKQAKTQLESILTPDEMREFIAVKVAEMEAAATK